MLFQGFYPDLPFQTGHVVILLVYFEHLTENEKVN